MLRPIRLVSEIIIACIFILGVSAGGLIWRLQQEPLHIDTARTTVEDYLGALIPTIHFSFNGAQLEAGNSKEAFQLTLTDISIINQEQDKIGSAEKLSLGFSWRNLLMLSFVPNSLNLYGPSFQIERLANGSIGFKGSHDIAKKSSKDKTDLHHFFDTTPNAFKEIRIKDAWIQFNDTENNLTLEAKKGDFILARTDNSLEGVLSLDMTANEFHQSLKGTVSFDPDDRLARIDFAIRDIPMQELGKLLVQIPDQASLSSLVTAAGEVTIDHTLQPLDFNFNLSAEKGTLLYPPYYKEPVAFDALLLKSRYNFIDDSLTIDPSSVTIGSSIAVIEGHIKQLRHTTHAKEITLRGYAENIVIDNLDIYWPHNIGIDARDWVTQHISEGIVNKATLDFKGRFDPSTKAFSIKELGGKIDINNATVDYLPPLPQVTSIKGVATYSDRFFNIEINEGEILDTSLKNATLKISGFDHHTQRLDMLFNLDGPISDTLKTVSEKPLEYLQKLNLTPDQFLGNARTLLYLGMPLIKNLKLDDVDIKATSTLNSVTAKNIVKSSDLAAEKLLLKIDNDSLVLLGDATVSGSPVQLQWKEYFDSKEPIISQLFLDGRFDTNLFNDLGINVQDYLSGYGNGNVTVLKNRDKSLAISAKGDMTNALITVDYATLQKPLGQAAKIQFDLLFEDNGPITLSNGLFESQAVSAQEAMARWSSDGKLESATLKNIKVGRTNTSVVISPIANDHLRVVAKGNVIDLSGFWNQNKKEKAETPLKTRYDLSIRTPKLFLDESIPLTNTSADISFIDKKILTMSISATVEDATLKANQTQNPNGIRQLTVNANKAGKIFQALNITDTVRDGTLNINATSTIENPTDLSGTLVMDRFMVVRAPLLARLINALSPGGLLDLLNNKGLNFDSMRNEIIIRDDGVIRLRKGRLAGGSLGMTYSGRLYLDNDTMNIKGTLIPVEGINKIASKIPVLGTLLTGLDGEGILAATYRIKGPTDDPNVTVNPLSALAPGILRSIFFENNREE